MNKIFLILISIFVPILVINVVSATDVLVWQGQYYTGTTFNTGSYNFNFTVYDALTAGNICYSNTTSLTTGNFGEWKTEQYNVSSSCSNVSKDYFLNINISGVDQTPRRRLVVWNSLRKDVNETTIGTIQSVSQVIASSVNATQVIANNLTTTNYGFFTYLGSLVSRVTSLWVQTIYTDNIITNISTVQANNGKNFTIGFDGSNNLYMNQTSASGYLQFMNTANSPQILAGISNATGAFYIDMSNKKTMYLNGIQAGDVETGGNFTVGNLLKLSSITLPACSIDGLIGKNATGIYFCNSTTWRQFNFVN